jgi:predicted ABC-type transport system involved in lysophospholipase L1 biosynthesis ATPase subunit
VSVLEISDVRKTYRMGATQLEVLKGVSLNIIAGETVAIMGPSGAGKSTLLHILGGLDRPTSGQVTLEGQDLYALSAPARNAIRADRIGFVFQGFHLLPELDIVENVMVPALIRPGGWRRRAVERQRAEELLARVGLADRRQHRPTELSGGEQQRVALARALMNGPDLILADEPTGNLDTHTGFQVLECLFELTSDQQHTLIMVTHNEQVAARCRRTIRMVDGVIAASG